MTPAAPLEKAGTILRRVYLQLGSQAPAEYNEAVEALLASLDADKRLEKAETLVRAIVSERHRCFIPTNIPEAPALMNWDECARRYFAEKGERP